MIRKGEKMEEKGYVTHELRLSMNFCDAVYCGRKSFEIRKNDRGFQTGDHIRFTPFKLGESDPEKMYPDHPIKYEEYIIVYILTGWGIEKDFMALGIKKV